jgi:hypothetical protein
MGRTRAVGWPVLLADERREDRFSSLAVCLASSPQSFATLLIPHDVEALPAIDPAEPVAGVASWHCFRLSMKFTMSS